MAVRYPLLKYFYFILDSVAGSDLFNFEDLSLDANTGNENGKGDDEEGDCKNKSDEAKKPSVTLLKRHLLSLSSKTELVDLLKEDNDGSEVGCKTPLNEESIASHLASSLAEEEVPHHSEQIGKLRTQNEIVKL